MRNGSRTLRATAVAAALEPRSTLTAGEAAATVAAFVTAATACGKPGGAATGTATVVVAGCAAEVTVRLHDTAVARKIGSAGAAVVVVPALRTLRRMVRTALSRGHAGQREREEKSEEREQRDPDRRPHRSRSSFELIGQ